MSVQDFTLAILSLASRFRFSVTSWGRSEQHNTAVGGVVDSTHLYWLAVDVVLDSDLDTIAFCEAARRLGLVCLSEPGHLHVQIPRIKDS